MRLLSALLASLALGSCDVGLEERSVRYVTPISSPPGVMGTNSKQG